MSSYEIGIRKNVEFKKVLYWLTIRAKPIPADEEIKNTKDKLSKKICSEVSADFINIFQWKIFIMFTILVNTFITINFYSDEIETHFITLVIIVHLTCFFFWIDFLAMVAQKIKSRKKPSPHETRNIVFLVLEAISLLPFSTVYLITVSHPNKNIFWDLRFITLLRFYRIPYFLSRCTTAGKNHGKIFLAANIFYLIIFIDIFASSWMTQKDNYTFYNIENWNISLENKFITSLYFAVVTVLNVGYGDIVPLTYLQMIACIAGMVVGCSITTGVINGALAATFSNREKTRELYRHEYKVIMKTLKNRKIDKKTLDKISENLLAQWKYKKGYLESPPYHLLPFSLQKELNFDVNFGLLNRSIIFSMQPRAFLRSVSLKMRNLSFLPGDIIKAPIGISDVMICIASGVIEVLSEENDETPLFSLTSGTIIGEANLFITIPIRFIIRASTFVELQVLKKTYFARLALKYPEIYRSMRAEIFNRLTFMGKSETEEVMKTLDSDYYELTRRKATKHFLQELRRKKREEFEISSDYKTSILSLYVLSENIPKVKTLPINLIRNKPWILRPETNLMEIWNIFIIFIVTVVVFAYPYLASFVRRVDNKIYVLLLITEVVYITDLYIQCTTAIERKDHFTYITSIKEIIGYKLKTVGFYLDVLATYQLYIFSYLINPDNPDYAYLLLSQNRILKFWHVPCYFSKLENNMRSNLLLVRTIKYMYYLSMIVMWSAAVLFLEACPGEFCLENRWYAELEKKEVENLEPTPCTEWPVVISLYGACETVSGVGYGDVTAKAIPDCIVFIFCIILGSCLLTFCLAQASATFRHLARMKTYYQEEIFAINRFLAEHDIPKDLQRRIRNYFQLQWIYDKGLSLQRSNIQNGLPSQQKEVELMELMKIFLTVPLFKEANVDFLKLLAQFSKVRVLPPDEVITDVGDLARDMYIIENGYCEITIDGKTMLFGPVTPFGYVEMILGIPLNIKVITVTHARVLSLSYSLYLRAVTQYPNVKNVIDDILEKNYKKGKENFIPLKTLQEKKLDDEALKKQKILRSKTFINVYNYHKSLSKNYWEPFRPWGKFRFLQFGLLPFVIGPHSLFLKIWMSMRIVSVLIIGLVAPIHFSLSATTRNLSILIFIIQGYGWIDMYLMFHVGYYDERGILMFHPAKTSVSYLKGSFILDLIGVFPFYLVIQALFPRDMNTPNLLNDAPGFIMVLQFYKFFLGCYYLENDILRRAEKIQTLKFIPLAIVITNIITGLLILLECHDVYFHGKLYNEPNKLANEYQRSIIFFCIPRGNNSSHSDQNTAFKLYVMTFYWVTATMTGCGFGDLQAHSKTTMIAVIIMIALGIFLYGYMFASLTSGMISVYNLVTNYRIRVLEMRRLMRKENVRHDLQKRLIFHYEYNWRRTEGTKPQKMLKHVYGALREELVASMYEATIRQVPAFLEVEKSVTRVIGKYLDEVYFLQGETIVKYNDIQEYIYLIHRGKVEVVSEKGDLITTMGSGGLFGNISKKPFSLSSVNVVAKKNVDMLRLNSRIFFNALQVIPNTESLINFLKSITTDFIEPLSDNIDESENINIQVTSSQLDTISYKAAEQRNVKHAISFSRTELLPHKANVYLSHSIFRLPTSSIFTSVILPDSPLYNGIGVCIFIMSYLSCVVTMYMFAFQDFSMIVLIISYFLDFTFFIKIGLEFQVSYFDQYGDYVVNIKKVRKRYLNSKKRIGIDIAANLPLDFLAFVVPKAYILKFLSILRLNRILRVFHIFEFYEAKFKNLMINKIFLELSYLLVCISLLVHLFSCIWYFVACPFDYCQKPTWVTEMSLLQNEKWHLYIVSFYYVITIAATTGYGEIPVVSTAGVITSILVMIFSRFGIVLLAGSMVSLINANSYNLFLYQERIAQLKASYICQNISEYQVIKMWNYVTSLWLRESGKQIPKFITTAPYVMKCEVMSEMFGKHLSQSYVFSNTDDAFLRQLSIYLMRFVYFPGNYIVQQGDIDHTMYFIHKGEVSVLTIHPNLMETIHFTLIENDHFGMTQGLILGKCHQFSYRAETEVEILSLTLREWQHLLKYFPSIAQKIYKRIDSLPAENIGILDDFIPYT